MRNKLMALFLGLCMIFGLMIIPFQNVYAETNEAVQEDRNGILQVRCKLYINDEECPYYVVGTGFLVGNDESAQTVITNHHVISYATYTSNQLKNLVISQYLEMYEEYYREYYGITDEEELSALLQNVQAYFESVLRESNNKVSAQISVVVKRDVTIKAEVVNYSEDGDFAILKLEQPIYDREPLTFTDATSVVTTQPVYALGFPGLAGYQDIDNVYTANDVIVTSGIVSKVAQNNSKGAMIDTFVHSAQISSGNSGGPLVDENGYVVGLNTYYVSQNSQSYYYSTSANEITDILGALGIDFMYAGASNQTPAIEPESQEPESIPVPETEAQAAEADFTALNGAITSAEGIDLSIYTPESKANFEVALSEAKAVAINSTSSQEEIDKAADNLRTAQSGLVEQPKSNMTLIIIIAAVVLVVIIVVVVLIVVSSGKKKKRAEAERRQRMTPPVQQPPQRPPYGGPQQTTPVHPGPSAPTPNPNGFAMNDGAGETSVLNSGAGETTVLGGGQSIPTAVLTRKKNNERVTISKAVFKIGKERRRVDYCISDNSNISRAHADIVFKNGAFYIVDQNATNGTFVNGSSVAAGSEVMLKNNDIVKLADEEFQFKTL